MVTNKLLLINFKGGLGNQLFQYASARGLVPHQSRLIFNINSYDKDYYGRDFKLMNYNVKGTLVTPKLKFLIKPFIPDTKYNFLFKKTRLLSNIEEKGFYIHKDLSKNLRILSSLEGYWQSYKYFNHKRHELLSELKPLNTPDFPKWIDYENTVAVHVRRTDYIKDSRYGFIGLDYYNRAFELFNSILTNPMYILFSDDLLWCSSNFESHNIQIFEDKAWEEDYLQLYLMSLCKHQLIANSSFSWWSAWLNKNPEKIVVCPNNPFKDPSLLYESYYPNEWVRI